RFQITLLADDMRVGGVGRAMEVVLVDEVVCGGHGERALLRVRIVRILRGLLLRRVLRRRLLRRLRLRIGLGVLGVGLVLVGRLALVAVVLVLEVFEAHRGAYGAAGAQVARLLIDRDVLAFDRRLRLPQPGIAAVIGMAGLTVIDQMLGGDVGRLVVRENARLLEITAGRRLRA